MVITTIAAFVRVQAQPREKKVDSKRGHEKNVDITRDGKPVKGKPRGKPNYTVTPRGKVLKMAVTAATVAATRVGTTDRPHRARCEGWGVGRFYHKPSPGTQEGMTRVDVVQAGIGLALEALFIGVSAKKGTRFAIGFLR
jgi:hypothetical protein